MNLVESTAEVIENVREFSNIVKGDSIAYDHFSQFFHWYYFPELGLFAPSKFIGYKNTTVSNYVGKGNGGETQAVLNKWFSKLDRTSEEYTLASDALQVFSAKIGKKISAKVFNGTGGIYLLSSHVNLSLYPDETNEPEYKEGKVKQVTVNAIERNPEARRKCIEYYGAVCNSCDFDFSEKYGAELGSGFIHVHHVLDIALVGKSTK